MASTETPPTVEEVHNSRSWIIDALADARREQLAGSFRGAADRLVSTLQTMELASPDRYRVLRLYCSILSGMYFKPEPEKDLLTLKQILRNDDELDVSRARAVLTIGELQWYHEHRHDEAGDRFRDAIGFVERVSDEEKEHEIYSISGVRLQPVRDVLPGLKAEAQGFLNALLVHPDDIEQQTVPATFLMPSTTQFVKTEHWPRQRPNREPVPQDGRQIKFHFYRYESNDDVMSMMSNPEIRKLLTVGGEACDCCGKPRSETIMTCLDICNGCKRAYFCSRKCQRKQWRAGHKDHCRGPGEIRAGDFVVIWGLQEQPELDGAVVRVVTTMTRSAGGAPVESNNSNVKQWLVEKPGMAEDWTIAAENLFQLRPLK